MPVYYSDGYMTFGCHFIAISRASENAKRLNVKCTKVAGGRLNAASCVVAPATEPTRPPVQQKAQQPNDLASHSVTALYLSKRESLAASYKYGR